jgi:predicted nucleic-acid-binding protein
MKVTLDTNVLVRGVVHDDEEQAKLADNLLRRAEMIAITVPCLCELVWVLRSIYGFKRSDATAAIRALLVAGNVETNRPAVEAGLAMLDAGGDFADGVIAYEGKWLGAETFVSFDKKAVARLSAAGVSARVL